MRIYYYVDCLHIFIEFELETYLLNEGPQK